MLRNYLIIVNVYVILRRYKKLNGNIIIVWCFVQNRIWCVIVLKMVSYGDLLSEGDGVGFLRILDSIFVYLGLRSVYDFVEVSRSIIGKFKLKLR